MMLYDKESGVRVKETAAKSGAQDDGEKRAEETAATVTGTSGQYATPIEGLGQPSLDGRREPGPGNRLTYRFESKSTRELARWSRAAWSSSCSRNAHARKVLVRRVHSRIHQVALWKDGRAWKGRVARQLVWSLCSQSPHDKRDWKDTHVGPVLPEQGGDGA